MINALVGPAKANELLAEARWAVDTYRKACEVGGKDAFAQMQVIARAHAALASDRTHALLAENPLVPLPAIQQEVFETLAGEKASVNRGQVALAAAGFAQAEQKGRPVLLVLTAASTALSDVFPTDVPIMARLNTRPLAAPVRGCEVVQLPIDELPALTNLVNIPEVVQADGQSPTIVMTRSDGTQLAEISANKPPREIARQIWVALNQFRLERAEELMASGKLHEATSLFKLVKASPYAGPLKDKAVAKLAELQSLPGSQNLKSPAPAPVNDNPKKSKLANRGGLPDPRLASSSRKRNSVGSSSATNP